MTTTGKRFYESLTPAEARLLELLTQTSETNVAIGIGLGVSDNTVRKHSQALLDKSGMSTRLELLFFAVEHGVVACPCKRARL